MQTMKLHLPAKAPSEGARRIAQWVMTLAGGLGEAAEALDVPVMWVQRMVEGDMVPGLKTGARLSALMGVTARQFHAAARGGWFDHVPVAVAA